MKFTTMGLKSRFTTMLDVILTGPSRLKGPVFMIGSAAVNKQKVGIQHTSKAYIINVWLRGINRTNLG